MRVLISLLLMAAPALGAEWFVDFEKGLDGWHLPRPEDWALADDNGNHFLRLEKPGPVGDPRRPVKFALFEPGCVSDFELTVKVRRRKKSLLIAFGFQDRAHFYYAHISRDDGSHRVHNGVFKVAGGERYRIAGSGSAAALPSADWHRIRVRRETASGKIEVYVDDDPEPRFEVLDESYAYGWVGLGSFDEIGDFDDFRLNGEPSRDCRPETISPLDAR